MQKLYIYKSKYAPDNIVRTGIPYPGESPTWSDVGCVPFENEIVNFIEKVLIPNYSLSHNRGFFRLDYEKIECMINFVKTLGREYEIHQGVDARNYILVESGGSQEEI